jgi:pyridoxal phosphate enzyme (YggS family)
MIRIASALQAVRARIEKAAREAGRDPAEVALLAVSKTFSPDAIRAAHAAGQRLYGENYIQEALPKIDALRDLPDVEWHFIGPLQSNKTRPAALHFAWVHGIDRLRIAQRLSDARPPGLPPLQCCVQVNISGEPSKSGARPEEALALAREVAVLPRLSLRGFMGMSEGAGDEDARRRQFRLLRGLLEEARAAGLALDTLSMGMSGDLELAVAEGATLVRVGTAVFGARPYP